MTQQQLDREVANSLGEDIREINRRGFSIVDLVDIDFDPEPDDMAPQMLDWDDNRYGDPSPTAGLVDMYRDGQSA